MALFKLKSDPISFSQDVQNYSKTIDKLNTDFYDACKRV